ATAQPAAAMTAKKAKTAHAVAAVMRGAKRSAQRISDQAITASLISFSMTERSARDQFTHHEADPEGDKQTGDRLIPDVVAPGFGLFLAALGEVLVEAVDLVADFVGDALGLLDRGIDGRVLEPVERLGEVALQRGDIRGDSVEVVLLEIHDGLSPPHQW